MAKFVAAEVVAAEVVAGILSGILVLGGFTHPMKVGLVS